MTERWLVIDDSATIQRVIKLAFQDYDVGITEADSCLEANREMQRQAPTLVIADAAVTGAQSVQDFVTLRNLAPQTPFIILEGSYDNIDESQFRGAGFFHFLKKPFDAAQLLEVTHLALNRALPLRNAAMAAMPPPPPNRRSFGEEPTLVQTQISAPYASQNAFEGSREGRGHAQPLQPSAPLHAQPSAQPQRTQPSEGSPWMQDQREEKGQTGRRPAPISFSLDDDIEPEIRTTPQPWESGLRTNQSQAAPQNLQGMLEPFLKEEMERWVKASVEDYCRKHFASIAREMIGREIERLTQERSRLLVDK